MKTLTILFLLGALAWAQQVNTPTSPVVDGERVLLLKGRVAGDMKSWLVIEVHNGSEYKQDGYNPSFTRVLSDYMPIFRKLSNGQWEIGFTSEIARNLP